MNLEEYVARLKSELKGFPEEEKSALIEEIASHIEAGERNSQLGETPNERQKKLDHEMGSPEDLGRRLKEVHHPNRWIDYSLVLIPAQILPIIIAFVLTLLFGLQELPIKSTSLYAYKLLSLRAIIIIGILMVTIGLRRFSIPLLLFWLPQTIIMIFTLVYREKRWMLQSEPFNTTLIGVIESLFWLALMIAMIVWLARLLWRNRHDPLYVVLASLPFLITVGNMTVAPLFTGEAPGGYSLPSWHVNIAGFPFGLYQASEIIWPALFFVAQQRPLRWLGLIVYAVPLATMNLVASSNYPMLLVMWSLPILLVLVGWGLDILQGYLSPLKRA